MSNNGPVFTKQVRFDLISKFKQNAKKIDKKIDSIQQQVVEDFGAVDSGLMQVKTFAKFEADISNSIVGLALFKTRGVNYAQYVINGTGTNRSYGERNYLVEGRQQAIDYILTDNYTRTFKRGSPNKKGRQVAKRKF